MDPGAKQQDSVASSLVSVHPSGLVKEDQPIVPPELETTVNSNPGTSVVLEHRSSVTLETGTSAASEQVTSQKVEPGVDTGIVEAK